MKAIPRTSPKMSLFLLLLVAAGLTLIVSSHARNGHKTDLYSPSAILQVLESATINGSRYPCQRVEVASCLFATNHDINSLNYGRPSPQARALCVLTDANLMGVFGLGLAPAKIVYVTGYAISYPQWLYDLKRDKCTPADVTYLQGLIGAVLP